MRPPTPYPSKAYRPLALVAVLAAGACSGPDAGPGGRSVRNDGPLPDTAELVMDRTVLLPREGVRLTALAPLPDGGVAAATSDGSVFVVGDDTEIEELLAAPVGDAPRRIVALAGLSDGRWAYRDASGTVEVRNPAGQVTNRWTVDPTETLWGRQALVALHGDTLLAGAPRVGGMASPGTPEASDAALYRRLLPAEGAVPTAVLGQDLNSDTVSAPCVDPDPHFRSGWFRDVRVRYLPMPVWTVSSEGRLILGCPAEYAFQVRPLSGSRRDALRVEMTHWARVVVPQRERQEFVTLWTAFMNNSGRGVGWTFDGEGPRPLKPAYLSVHPSSDGSTWVWPAQPSVWKPTDETWPLAGLPEGIWAEATRGTFDVFGPGGRLEGHVRTPGAMVHTAFGDTPEPVIRGDTVWAATAAPEGRPGLARFRVERE